MKQLIYTLFLFFTLFYGCKETVKEEQEINKIKVALKFSRFDREIAKATPANILDLKQKYPYLFPEQYPDSVWVNNLKDTLQISLLQEVDKTFGDFKAQKQDIELFYKHVLYYFPREKTPEIITVISNVNYNNPVILTDKFLLLGLDNYLGQDHKFYVGLKKYVAAGLDKKYLLSDVASTFAKKVVPAPSNDRTFLAKLIFYGKELYVKDKLIPFVSDDRKIKYTQKELDWAVANEEQIWRNFIENKLLYSTDNKLSRKFLDPAPFSKFNLELDNESPGRLGRYIGWQIVRSFMKNNDVSLEQLLSLPAEKLFKESNYKPKR